MKKQTGWFATAAIALAAFFGMSRMPSRSDAGSASSESTQQRKAGAKEKLPNKSGGPGEMLPACAEIKERLSRFLPKDAQPGPGSCFESGEPSPLKNPGQAKLHFIVATLPDPVHTHFSVVFDRGAEAIQQAAQDEGYTYDSSWLPWVAETREYSGLDDQLKADTLRKFQEAQPGVVVFRKAAPPGGGDPYGEALVVFVVGENPTGGIRDEQFRNAVGWLRALRPGGLEESFRVLSPFFSGSFPSLFDLLKVENANQLAGAAFSSAKGADGKNLPPIQVMGGSATSHDGIERFRKQIQTLGGVFLNFQENDDVMTDRYCQYLHAQGYDIAGLAIISEDETAYGVIKNPKPSNETIEDLKFDPYPHCNYKQWSPNNAASATDLQTREMKGPLHGPLFLYYPRDIAALRSAYEKQSISGPTMKQSDQGNAPRTALQDDLSEPSNSEHDTIRTYGGDQTPLSQESTLFALTNLLKAHNIQFIVLKSSNPLDQIFLTRFLRRSYPAGRVVLAGSDLLFSRTSETANFRGTMTLTTYPLLPWQQDWTLWQGQFTGHGHRTFTMDATEGLYLATRFLINARAQVEYGDGFLRPSEGTPPIPDYGPPTWLLPQCAGSGKVGSKFVTRPPTWLSVIGSSGFWPVATLDECTLARHDGDPVPDPNDSSADIAPMVGTLPRALTPAVFHQQFLQLLLPIRICLLLTFVWCAWHLYCCCWGSQAAAPSSRALPSPRYMAYFSPIPRPQQKVLLLIGSVVIAMWGLALVTLTGMFYRNGAPFYHHGRLLAAYCGLFLMLTIAVAGSFRTPRMTATNDAMRTLHGISRWRSVLADWRTRARSSAPRVLAACSGFVALVLVAGWVLHREITDHLSDANAMFSYWRSVNLFTGISPLLPFLLLWLGFYGWFWFQLSGMALFNGDRPLLPTAEELGKMLPMFSRDHAETPIESAAIPLGKWYIARLPLIILTGAIVWIWVYQSLALRSLANTRYGIIFFVPLMLCITLILTDAWQMLSTWGSLRWLLVYLDRLRLRRTLEALKGFSWGTVWKMSGNVLEQRYRLISRQFESLRNLRNELRDLKRTDPRKACSFGEDLYDQVDECDLASRAFAAWFIKEYDQPGLWDMTPVETFQKELAKTAGMVASRILVPQWQEEKGSLILDLSKKSDEEKGDEKKPPVDSLPPYLRAAEEFFLLPYLGFIQNILGRIRTIALGMLCLFLAATLSVASYPFDPRPVLSGIFLFVFFVVGAIVFSVYAEMHRDATLSHITNTNPGELGMEFWFKLIAFGAGPLLGLLAAVFPEISGFVTSWLQPGVEAIK